MREGLTDTFKERKKQTQNQGVLGLFPFSDGGPVRSVQQVCIDPPTAGAVRKGKGAAKPAH